MTDKELLELAAKAYWSDEIGDVCDIEWSENDQAIVYTHGENQDHNGIDQTYLWNPLTDDGDAFRLAVKLRISVYQAPSGMIMAISADGKSNFKEEHPACPYAATRRAIVRAAEIGKTTL